MGKNNSTGNPWTWIPTLYFAEGLPYIAVNNLSVIMYKNLGMSNTDIALYTSWLYLPWVIKPFWSPFVDILKTKRWWILMMQYIIGAGLAGIAFTLPLNSYIQWTMAIFWIIGFASATHDISADGFYMLALNSSDQSLFVGIRSTFYRIAQVVGQGALVVLSGWLFKKYGGVEPVGSASMPFWAKAWSTTFFIIAVFFVLIAVYHHFMLPKPESDRSVLSTEKLDPDAKGAVNAKSVAREFFGTFGSFFEKKGLFLALAFILLYRLPEAQLMKIINPFLLDPKDVGGLGLTNQEVGIVYGTIGVIGLTVGGIIGGIVASRGGLKKWLRPMAWSMSLPCLAFCYLSMAQPSNVAVISTCVFLEQFGYGFGFSAYMLFMMYFSEGTHKTSHYAICTGFMALSMMIPGMWTGALQQKLGYVGFFWWVMICCIATIVMAMLVKVDPEYGKAKKKAAAESVEKNSDSEENI
ncbi:MAG: MFS transporter [Bacteroidales bacterium]|jgi:PAT family beta-lactamase induction signal transducer AmpG|nr:MFS transporter [Bacteroidales bacterium]MCI2122021.1 MFS transporter [Bacteroidales bacterium]MCI2146224.1 MFS transporter [Bacteroidales bacterium]